MKNFNSHISLCTIVSLAVLLLVSCSPDEGEKLIVTRQDSLSYGLGVAFAQKIPQNLKDNKIEAVDIEYFAQGIYDFLDKNSAVKLTDDEVERVLNSVISRQLREKQEKFITEHKPNIDQGKSFLEKNKANYGVIEIKDGLQYKVVTPSWGKLAPLTTDTIFVNFKIYDIYNKLLYDSKTKSDPTKLYLGSAIPALQEVLTRVKTGGSVRIFTSHEFAYGTDVSFNDAIKPYQTIIIDVELTKIRLNAKRLNEFNRLVELEQQKNNQTIQNENNN